MRKGFIFAGLLITLLASYLFYRSCKRDTLVISPAYRISLPDSSWLYGSINLEQIRKDIAWSTMINGDFNKIFKTDTNTNTLLKILRAPDTYLITEKNDIRYFSIWKDSAIYKGLLFRLENHSVLKHTFKSDSFTLNQQQTYSFRTGEGFWLYDSNNLLFLSGPSDSLIACRFFPIKDSSHIPVEPQKMVDTLEFISDQTTLISGYINTLFVPAAIKPAIMDSASLSFKIMSNDDLLDIKWTYAGFLSDAFNQTSITHMNTETAVFCVVNPNISGMKRILKKMPSFEDFYVKQQSTLDPFLSAINNNNLAVEFNGWKKIKNSYYTSVLNDEFETVLQKKDSSIVEPIFKISLEQKNRETALKFLSYLQKQGLVSKGKQQPFALIYGNFDSELSLDTTNTFIIHNKHTPDWPNTTGPEPLDVSILLTIQPSLLKGLSDSKINTSELVKKIDPYVKSVSDLTIHAQKDKNNLTGNIKIKFTDKSHPFIAFTQMLKK